MGDTRFLVKKYIDEGWSVLPIPKGSKAPEVKDWVNRTFTVEDFEADSNIGVRLGKPSGHLVDVDLDCPEAVIAAKILLPDTERKHGRPGTGDSHYWYICEGATSQKWCDTDGKVLVELRSTGGQTVVPPSIHPSGEQLYWASERSPLKIALEPLVAHGRDTATSALLGRHWPATGSRHNCASFAAGYLAARDLDIGTICNIIKAACTAAGDNEIEDRLRAASDSVKAFVAGGKTTGGPSLADLVGKDVVALLAKWFGGNKKRFDEMVEEMNQRHFVARLGKDHVIATIEEDDVYFQKEYSLHLHYANQKVVVGVGKRKQTDEESKETTEITEPKFRTKFDIWKEHPKRRTYRTITFAPPPAKASEQDYNLWTGYVCEPMRPAKDHPLYRCPDHFEKLALLRDWVDTNALPICRPFFDLIGEVICNSVDEYFRYMVNLLALTVQCPGVPSEVAVVMRGDQGAGKGTFARGFGGVFGRHGIHLDRTEQLAGKFNAALSGKVFIFADEAFFAGDKSSLGSLKRIITEPTLAIERKGFDVVQEMNFAHLFMATNHEFAHQAGFKERRFFTTHVNEARIGQYDYFNGINELMKAPRIKGGACGPGLPAMLSYLLTRAVDHNAVRKVPRTRELRAQQELSLDPELRWWRDKLYDGYVGEEPTWPDLITPEDLFSDYLRWCDLMKNNRRSSKIDLTRRVLAPWLVGGRVFRKAKWHRVLRPLAESRAVFDELAGTPGNWEEDDGAKGPDGGGSDGSEGGSPRPDLPF